MLDRIGDEMVAPPGGQGGAATTWPPDDPPRAASPACSGRARSQDAEGAAIKLIIEYLDGKAGDTVAAPGDAPALCADDMALAETLLREGPDGTRMNADERGQG